MGPLYPPRSIRNIFEVVFSLEFMAIMGKVIGYEVRYCEYLSWLFCRTICSISEEVRMRSGYNNADDGMSALSDLVLTLMYVPQETQPLGSQHSTRMSHIDVRTVILENT